MGVPLLLRQTNSPTEYSGEFSYLNFSMKIKKKIDEWMKAESPEVDRLVPIAIRKPCQLT